MDEIIQKLAGEWGKLPAPLQDFILDERWENRLSAVASKHNLNPEQERALKIEILLALFCLEDLSDLDANIKTAIPETQTESIASDVRREVLEAIKDELTRINHQLAIQDQIINDRIAQLPDELQQAINTLDIEKVVQNIGQKHGLHVDQLGQVDNGIWQVMLGHQPASKFTANIQTGLGISPAEAEQIAMEVNREIFVKIRESLKQLEERQNTPASEELLREINQPTTISNILERKLSESVNLKPVEEGITGTPDTPAELEQPIHSDPYLEKPE